MSVILFFQKIKRLCIDHSRRIDTDTILKSFQRRFNRCVEQCFTFDKRFFKKSLVYQDILQLGYIRAPHFFFQDPITQEAFHKIRKKLSADFVDYKNRAIIASETRDLRNILYAKAFANSDDFVEFEFKD